MSVIVEVACAGLLATGLVLMITVYESNKWTQSDTGTVFTQANTKVISMDSDKFPKFS